LAPLAPGFLGDKTQFAYVVRDLDAALRHWTDVMKVGPFVVIEDSRGGREIVHRGKPTSVEFGVAFAYLGDVQIELIHQTNDAPSLYKEFLDDGREGLHHTAFWPADLDAACTHLELRGYTVATSILAADGTASVVHFEAPPFIGGIVELLPMTVDRKDYYGRIQRLGRDWNGFFRPIRRYRNRDAFLALGEGLASHRPAKHSAWGIWK
jgi:hypothetical protein